MIFPQEAETLAQGTLENYINSCDCKTPQDVANVLMKLISMSGLAMCSVVGQQEAVARLQGTTNRIAKSQSGKNWFPHNIH